MATNKYYRTKDGLADYGFCFEQQAGGNWRVYITNSPNYGGRTSGSAVTHRYTDGHGRRYVCWDQPLQTLQDAEKVAALWADVTQEYIKTGRTIDEQMRGQR